MFECYSRMLEPAGGTEDIIMPISSMQNLTPSSRHRPPLYWMYHWNALHNMLCNTCREKKKMCNLVRPFQVSFVLYIVLQGIVCYVEKSWILNDPRLF